MRHRVPPPRRRRRCRRWCYVVVIIGGLKALCSGIRLGNEQRVHTIRFRINQQARHERPLLLLVRPVCQNVCPAEIHNIPFSQFQTPTLQRKATA